MLLFFDKYFDIEYAKHIHQLILKEIDNLCPEKTLHISHMNWDGLTVFKNFLNFEKTYNQHKGKINHYNVEGNAIIYSSIKEHLEKL